MIKTVAGNNKGGDVEGSSSIIRAGTDAESHTYGSGGHDCNGTPVVRM